jgi:ParB family chromosome partitioning protein
MKKFSPNTNNVFSNEKVIDGVKIKGKMSHGDIQYLPVQYIVPGRYQVRENFSEEALEELKISILNHGILQPITVRKIDSQKYELISGERRLRAARMAGLTHVPAIVSHIEDETALALGIIENVQRENINAIEEANGYKMLIAEFDYTHLQISESVGKSRTHITNILRVLTLSEPIQKAMLADKISLGHAKVLLSAPEDKRDEFLRNIIDKHMSVRSSERYRDRIITNDYNSDIKFKNSYNCNFPLADPQTDALNKLNTVLPGRATLKQMNYGRYKLECTFDSYEDFELFVTRHIEELIN